MIRHLKLGDDCLMTFYFCMHVCVNTSFHTGLNGVGQGFQVSAAKDVVIFMRVWVVLQDEEEEGEEQEADGNMVMTIPT